MLPDVDDVDGPCLHLGCGREPIEGWHNVDLVDGPGVDEATDLSQTPWPWPDDWASVILAENLLEHLSEPDHAVKEAHRVLQPDGLLLIEVPHKDGRHGCQIDHRSFWDEHTLDIYCGRGKAKKGLDAGQLFEMDALRVFHAHPFTWHQRRYLGTELVGFGPHKLRFVLRKPAGSVGRSGASSQAKGRRAKPAFTRPADGTPTTPVGKAQKETASGDPI